METHPCRIHRAGLSSPGSKARAQATYFSARLVRSLALTTRYPPLPEPTTDRLGVPALTGNCVPQASCRRRGLLFDLNPWLGHDERNKGTVSTGTQIEEVGDG
jgi:hypothetical protein